MVGFLQGSYNIVMMSATAVMAREYTSLSFEGLLFANLNWYMFNSSGAMYRTTPGWYVPPCSTTVGSVMMLVIPKSPRRALPSSVIRMFP